jgi:hypothetical protein
VNRWHDLGPASTAAAHHRWGRLVAAVAPFLIAGVLAVAGHVTLGVVLTVVAVGLLVLRAALPATGDRFDRALVVFGAGVGQTVSVVLLGVVHLVIFVPLSFVSRLLGRDPLRAPVSGSSTWQQRSDTRTIARRTFGRETTAPEPVGRVGRVVRATPLVVGWVALVVLANYAAGWAWDEYVGSHDVPAARADLARDGDLRSVAAMEDEDWADGYWDEFDLLRFEFIPFLLSRVADVDGPTISTSDGVRASLEADDAALQEVWVFGGGAVWGQGQRDEHTIASELVRRADAAGRPLRVRNFGQPGYTSWQSAMLVEQELAVRPTPDLIVLYDGADDVAVQVEAPSDRASHYNLANFQAAIGGRDSAREEAEDLWEEYRETSVLTRLAQGLGGIFSVQPAWADSAIVDRVERLHGESLDVITDLADRYGVATLYAWQAAMGVPGDGGAYRDLAGTDPSAVDLSRVLDDAEEHYLDGVLTDEDGARIVAEALWPLVAAELPPAQR